MTSIQICMNNNFFKNKRILVTGGTGFVGSHLVQQLITLGARVVVPYRSIDPYGYFATEALSERVVMVQADLRDRQRIVEVINRYEITEIFHLGAHAVVPTAYFNPQETLETNIMGTVHILEAARLLPQIRSVVFASSDKAYGSSDTPYVETDPLVGSHPYDVSKSAADLICQMYAKTYDVPVAITRFGNIYGEGDTHPSRVIPGILMALANQETFVIRSTGQYKRAYLSVTDVVEGYLRLAMTLPATRGEAFNFGSPEVYSVLELISIIEQTVHVSVPYTIANTAVGEIESQELSYEKAKTHLGWQPKHTLASSIAAMYAWYTRHQKPIEHGGNNSGNLRSQTIFTL